MANPMPMIDFQKCTPQRCNGGICAAVLECPQSVLIQEAPYDFPFQRLSRFCRGCSKCIQACPFEAIRLS